MHFTAEYGQRMRKTLILGACYNEDLQRTIVRLTPKMEQLHPKRVSLPLMSALSDMGLASP